MPNTMLYNVNFGQYRCDQTGNVEFSRGNRSGPMKAVHDAQITECIEAARTLVRLSEE